MRVMGNVEWEAVPTSDQVGVSAETEQRVLHPSRPSLEKTAFSWAGLGRIRRQLWDLLRSLSFGRGFCDPRLGPWLCINCLLRQCGAWEKSSLELPVCLSIYAPSFPSRVRGGHIYFLFFMKCKVIFLSIAAFTFDAKQSLYEKNGSQAINLTAAMRKMEREREATPFS